MKQRNALGNTPLDLDSFPLRWGFTMRSRHAAGAEIVHATFPRTWKDYAVKSDYVNLTLTYWVGPRKLGFILLLSPPTFFSESSNIRLQYPSSRFTLNVRQKHLAVNLTYAALSEHPPCPNSISTRAAITVTF